MITVTAWLFRCPEVVPPAPQKKMFSLRPGVHRSKQKDEMKLPARFELTTSPYCMILGVRDYRCAKGAGWFDERWREGCILIVAAHPDQWMSVTNIG